MLQLRFPLAFTIIVAAVSCGDDDLVNSSCKEADGLGVLRVMIDDQYGNTLAGVDIEVEKDGECLGSCKTAPNSDDLGYVSIDCSVAGLPVGIPLVVRATLDSASEEWRVKIPTRQPRFLFIGHLEEVGD